MCSPEPVVTPDSLCAPGGHLMQEGGEVPGGVSKTPGPFPRAEAAVALCLGTSVESDRLSYEDQGMHL